MPVKDGCNNTEKNRILVLHDQGVEPEVIARGMALTERIVNNMIDYYRKGGKEEREKKEGKEVRSSLEQPAKVTEDKPADDEPEPKPKAKKKPKKKAKATAEEDFK